MTKKQETQRGITLVALVITIVILIILATVSIGAIFGENGLINRAQESRNYQANAEAEENQLFKDAETAINDALGGNGESNGAKTLVQAFKDGDIAVGDYVNYKPEAHDPVTVGTSETGYTDSEGISGGTDQTFTQDPNTTWRVLGLSEDGQHLLLTSGSPIKKDGKADFGEGQIDDPYLVLESATGAGNCVQVLDKISGLYNNSTLADETRSITIEDIERVLGDMTVEYSQEGSGQLGKVYFTADGSKTPIGFASEASYTYRDTDWKLTNPPVKANTGEKVEGDGWLFTYTTEPFGDTKADYVPQRAWDMLFTDTTKPDNYAKSYWLASTGRMITDEDDFNYWGPGVVTDGTAGKGIIGRGPSTINLFLSAGFWIAYGCAVRPVVALKSNVSVEQVQKIDDQTEEEWSTSPTDYGQGNLNLS